MMKWLNTWKKSKNPWKKMSVQKYASIYKEKQSFGLLLAIKELYKSRDLWYSSPIKILQKEYFNGI
ncbi:hypothetical protein SOL01_05190 [Streptococcus cristatus]|uniref:Uncharacterized protein n=1 Tax=Streptococcus cristatus TaxID=45634 RepID=A0A512AAB3_STRCR|nr:hypothetical protein SOL01_05190 [Streptococcus cristatus]